jgi:hypothetical protein
LRKQRREETLVRHSSSEALAQQADSYQPFAPCFAGRPLGPRVAVTAGSCFLEGWV